MKPLRTALMLLPLLLTACGPSAEQQAALTAAALTTTAQSWIATATATATSTLTPTVTSTPTRTITPTRPSTKTLTPTQTPDPDRYYAPDSSYSLIAPEGWLPKDSDMPYPALVGPKVANFDLNLMFIQEQSAFPVAFYAAMVQDSLSENLQNLSQISEDFLTTDEGKDLFRWEITNTHQGVTYRQVYYFFEDDDWKLVVCYTRPKSQGSQYDAQVDEAMQTIRFNRQATG